jgi:hypothetical protein
MEDILTIFHIEKPIKSGLKTEGDPELERYWMKNEGVTASDLIWDSGNARKWRCDDAAMLQSLSTRALQAAREKQMPFARSRKRPGTERNCTLRGRRGGEKQRAPRSFEERIEILPQRE